MEDAFKMELKAALAEWDEIGRIAPQGSALEANLMFCAQRGIYHPLWERIREAHNALTFLGSLCMTEEQRAVKTVYLPYWQLEMLEIPTVYDHYRAPPTSFPIGGPFTVALA